MIFLLMLTLCGVYYSVIFDCMTNKQYQITSRNSGQNQPAQ